MSPKPSRQASKRATPTRRDSREISPAPNVIPSSPLTLIVPSPLVGASRNPSLSSYPWRNNRFHCLQVKTPVAVAARVYVPSPTKQWSAGFRNIFTVISLFFVFFSSLSTTSRGRCFVVCCDIARAITARVCLDQRNSRETHKNQDCKGACPHWPGSQAVFAVRG